MFMYLLAKRTEFFCTKLYTIRLKLQLWMALYLKILVYLYLHLLVSYPVFSAVEFIIPLKCILPHLSS